MGATFGRTVPVFVVRGEGTPKYQKWGGVQMGGDLKHTALFQPGDRVQRGDEIQCASLWVDVIRTKGKAANHEIRLMNQDDAKLLLSFLEMLLKFIYEFPMKVPGSSKP